MVSFREPAHAVCLALGYELYVLHAVTLAALSVTVREESRNDST